MIKKLYFLTILSLLLYISISVMISGCGKQADNLVTAPEISFHGAGWATPGNANFHGLHILSNNDWLLTDCKGCHGNDFRGGNTQVSCFKCHENGPTECNTCHGNSQHIYPPKSLAGKLNETDLGVGTHEGHLRTDTTQRISKPVRCVACHMHFNGFSDTNHISPSHLGVAAMVFDSLAITKTGGGTIVPNPSFDRATQKCSNVYCHGYFKNGNLTNQPTFTNPGSVYCGTCHGNPLTGDPRPGGTHPQENLPCGFCHGIVIDTNYVFINPSLHINGDINFNQK